MLSHATTFVLCECTLHSAYRAVCNDRMAKQLIAQRSHQWMGGREGKNAASIWIPYESGQQKETKMWADKYQTSCRLFARKLSAHKFTMTIVLIDKFYSKQRNRFVYTTAWQQNCAHGKWCKQIGMFFKLVVERASMPILAFNFPFQRFILFFSCGTVYSSLLPLMTGVFCFYFRFACILFARTMYRVSFGDTSNNSGRHYLNAHVKCLQFAQCSRWTSWS